MKISMFGAALLAVLSIAAWADDKPSLDDQCRAIADSHGIAPDKRDEWIKRCKDRTTDMQHRMDEKSADHDMSGMKHDGMGDMHGKDKGADK